MSKFIFFITLAFIYLTLLHSYSPFERQIIDVKDYNGLFNEIQSSPEFNRKHPYSVILVDAYKEGVFIKTSFARLKIISPFHPTYNLVFKITSKYYHYLKPYVGYEILHHNPSKNHPRNTILPPGFSFVGNPILGYWKKKSGKKVWAFYRFYRNLYKELGWDTPLSSFRPNVNQYRAIRNLEALNNKYLIGFPAPKAVAQTRERDNIILLAQSFFGVKGDHTPYIAPQYIERVNREQWANLSNVFASYFNIFFQPLKSFSTENSL